MKTGANLAPGGALVVLVVVAVVLVEKAIVTVAAFGSEPPMVAWANDAWVVLLAPSLWLVVTVVAASKRGR